MKKYFIVMLLIVAVISSTAFAADPQISGKAYLQYMHDQNGNSAFEATRLYLDIKRPLGDNLFRYTTDINTSAEYSIYTKYLYVELTKLVSGVTIQFGQIATPWIGFVDDIYGFRYLAKSMTDYNSILKSADRGVSIKTDLMGINLVAAVIGGSGYKIADADNKRDVAVRVDTKLDNLTLAAHAQISGTIDTLQVGNVLAAYKLDALKVAGEVALGKKKANVNILGISAVSTYALTSKITAFGRVDSYDPNTDKADDQKLLVIAGVEQQIAEKVTAALNIQYSKTGTADGISAGYVNLEVKI